MECLQCFPSNRSVRTVRASLYHLSLGRSNCNILVTSCTVRCLFSCRQGFCSPTLFAAANTFASIIIVCVQALVWCSHATNACNWFAALVRNCVCNAACEHSRLRVDGGWKRLCGTFIFLGGSGKVARGKKKKERNVLRRLLKIWVSACEVCHHRNSGFTISFCKHTNNYWSKNGRDAYKLCFEWLNSKNHEIIT